MRLNQILDWLPAPVSRGGGGASRWPRGRACPRRWSPSPAWGAVERLEGRTLLSAGDIEWIRQFGGTSQDSYDQVYSAATSGGYVYVAGVTGGALPGQVSSGANDAFVRKYDAAGDLLWTRQFGSASSDYAMGIVADVSGVYVAGYTFGALPGQMSSGLPDIFVRRYDAAGNLLWTRQFGSAGYDWANGVTADASGVYVAGTTTDALPGHTSSGDREAFVLKYDGSGNLLWTRQFGTGSGVGASGAAADASGVYVAGYAYGALSGQSPGGGDAFVRKYDRSGNLLWTRQFGSKSFDGAEGVTANASGVYVAGRTYGALPGQTQSGTQDAFVSKFDASGNPLWTRQFGPGVGNGVAADASGVYVAGATSGLSGQPPGGGAFVRKYDGSGNPVWTQQLGSSYGNTVAVDASGVYLAGTTGGTLPGQVSSGDNDAFLVKITNSADNSFDKTAPQTAVALTGPAGEGGSYAGPVTVTLTPSDPDDASAALTTTYSLDGGAPQTYAAPFDIAADGVHTLTYQSRDPAGNLEALRTLTVIISAPTPLAVAETVINGGATQRSNVETVAVRFNHPTNLPQLIASGSVSGAVRLVGAGGGAVPLAPSRCRYDQVTNVLTVDLTTDGFGGSRATMLGDGRYRLVLDTAVITALVSPSNHLWDDDGVADGVRQVAFSQLLGDYNGDGFVGLDDRSALLSHFGQSAATSAEAYLYDLDGNGVVNLADYLLWARRVGLIV